MIHFVTNFEGSEGRRRKGQGRWGLAKRNRKKTTRKEGQSLTECLTVEFEAHEKKKVKRKEEKRVECRKGNS